MSRFATALLLPLALVLSGCNGSGSQPAPAPTEPPAVSSPPPSAQPPTVSSPVTATATISKSSLSPGEEASLTINLRIYSGWHIYGLEGAGPSQPTQIKLNLPPGITAEGDWTAAAPDTLVTPFGPASIYHTEAAFTRPINVSDAAALGKHDIGCKIAYQACDHSKCLPPQTIELNVPLEVVRK
jgi:DsbC/DsbD-like thiol-disulfide interchange protein